MRQKNIRRAAQALYESQADDKNKLLASFIDNKEVRKRVADQGRALLILERLCLPQGKFSFTIEEIHSALLKKLEKKGHRIQEDDAEDDEQYAREKEQFTRERLALVDNVLGKRMVDLPPEEEKTPEPVVDCGTDLGDGPCHKDEFGNIVEGIEIQPYPAMTAADLPEFPEIPELPDIAWQLIGQAYIDGIRTGRDST